MHIDGEGRAYQDFYKMVLENESRTETQRVVRILKKECMAFARCLTWEMGGRRGRWVGGWVGG